MDKRFAVSALALGYGALAPRLAHAEGSDHAQDPGQDNASILAAPGTVRVGAEGEAAGFVLDGHRGSYFAGKPRLEIQPDPLVNLRLRVPFYSVALDSEPEARTGIGDVELRLRLNVRRKEPLKVSLGWTVQMPTGSRHDGLGEGAVQITPWITAGFRIRKTVVYLTVADNMSLAATHRPRLSNFVDPSEDNELHVTAGTITPLSEDISVSPFLGETTILTTVGRGDQLLTGGAQLFIQPDERYRIVVSEELPIAGEHRFSWKTGAFLQYSL